MTENNNFLISNKRHCENFRERKKKREKKKKSQNIFLRNYFRCIRKNSGETFARNFSLLSSIVNIPRFVGYTFQKDRKLRLPSFQRNVLPR